MEQVKDLGLNIVQQKGRPTSSTLRIGYSATGKLRLLYSGPSGGFYCVGGVEVEGCKMQGEAEEGGRGLIISQRAVKASVH
jgi:hypothetical protein